MALETPLDLATMQQVADELTARPNSEFILIYPDPEKPFGWDIAANGSTLRLARTLTYFSGCMLDFLAFQNKIK
jgi:hypothetical protein